MTEAERLAANSRPTLIDIVDMIARQYQCSLKEASEYLAEAAKEPARRDIYAELMEGMDSLAAEKGLDVSDSEHTIGQAAETHHE